MSPILKQKPKNCRPPPVLTALALDHALRNAISTCPTQRLLTALGQDSCCDKLVLREVCNVAVIKEDLIDGTIAIHPYPVEAAMVGAVVYTHSQPGAAELGGENLELLVHTCCCCCYCK